MAKYTHPDALDGGAAYTKANADRLIACSAQPANYAGVAAVSLADVAVDTNDFTHADFNTTGRMLTVSAQTGVTVDASGTFNHVAIVDDTNSKLLYVTTGTGQVLTAGNTVDFPAFGIHKVAQPT